MSGTVSEQVVVTVETDLDEATAEIYYELYQETFGELETLAVARQLLHRHEFFEEMHDPRVQKYVAWDDDGRPIGLTTLTNHLETVPWISPGYFRHHYPEAYARGAVYYIGFSLVRPAHRAGHVFQAMVHRMCEVFLAEDAVVGWDVCGHNDDELSFGELVTRIVGRSGPAEIGPIDRQTYYAGRFTPESGGDTS